MKVRLIFGLTVFFAFTIVFTSCNSDDVGGNLYTFTDKMMGQYIKDDTTLTEFNKLIEVTNVKGLLNAYGEYTCFAPTNEALRSYYKSKGKVSMKDFSVDSLKRIVYDHLIKGKVITYSYLYEGRLPQLTMSERFILISISDDGYKMLNNSSKISTKDIIVHNGVIHTINKVIDPTNFGIVQAIGNDTTFSLFYKALMATSLSDSLMLEKDESYDPTPYANLASVGSWFFYLVPQARKYGYTVLMESDDTYRAHGITNLETMKVYAASVYNQIYPEDAGVTDITNSRNSLNRFVAYHLINKQLSYTKFIDDYVMYNNSFALSHAINKIGLKMTEYLEPMCPNTLIEITRIGGTQETNLINRNSETGISIHIIKANSDNDATNGVYHEIDDILTYNQDVLTELSRKRLRFDAASFFPELTNNNMRGKGNTDPNERYSLPRGYIDRLTTSEQTVVRYLTPYDRYLDYQGDEIYLGASAGKLYDFTVVTPPVPAGTYEIRFGYVANGQRGVAQLYIDNIPCGVPLNLNKNADHPDIGYEKPGTVESDINGFENDKMMRNLGYMKGPASYRAPDIGWYPGESARYNVVSLRRILGIYNFEEAGNHLFTVKGLSGGEFMFDYLEFVPTSALESEDIY